MYVLKTPPDNCVNWEDRPGSNWRSIPFATVYEQDCCIYIFSQNTSRKEQQYERFSINIDVGSDIGVTQQHQELLSHVAE